MKVKLPRIMFAAPNSGSGKTTITCGILKALMLLGKTPAAFKCGPDYIDPMFHTEVIGAKSRNLDLFMLPAEVCRYLMAQNAKDSDIAVLEGVMGYYDGLSGNSTAASSYHLACVTHTPVILIVNGQGASLSVAALVKGFVQFRQDSHIKGVILNNISEGMFVLYKETIEKETGVKVVGFFPKMKDCHLESRHLGLITASEISNLQDKITLLAEQAAKTIDIEAILEIAKAAEPFEYMEHVTDKKADVTIAVAKDKAFCFYYQDSLELLESMGARLVYFSPLTDKALPDCDGLILGGGYPELYAKELSENEDMHKYIKQAVEHGLPCIAECGGFMYLLDEMTDKNGQPYKMAGCLTGKAYMTEKLNRFGYITLTSLNDNLLANKGDQINAHEFHYSDSTAIGCSFLARKRSKEWKSIHARASLFAGYPHLHLWGNIRFAYKFIDKCNQYHKERNQLK